MGGQSLKVITTLLHLSTVSSCGRGGGWWVRGGEDPILEVLCRDDDKRSWRVKNLMYKLQCSKCTKSVLIANNQHYNTLWLWKSKFTSETCHRSNY
jgi:hypothetical protein